MSKSVQLYPVLSFLIFYMIQISSKTYFAVFGIFLYIAAGIALLAYLESSERSKKSDVISVIAYILFTALFFILPNAGNMIEKTGLLLNSENLKMWWMPVYIVTIFIPVFFLYKNRANDKPLYIPVVLSAALPALLTGALLIFFADIRNGAVSTVANIIQVSIIDTLIKMKETMQIPDYYADMLSYLILNKETVAKQTVYIMPAVFSSIFVLITYMCDRMKPVFRNNTVILREFRLPDNLVWVLILGGFLILAPNIGLKYISYNVLALFALLYFFQGLQVVNKAFDKFQVSIFIRSLLLLFIFFYFTVIASMIVLIGIFSIWFKPKWLEKNSSDIDKNEGK
ncbi:MAG: YybS family protein [Mucispirillum sp.]|nr:YybS family protein [Mucispirillum sp.]